mgnify:CR=1 FL=1
MNYKKKPEKIIIDNLTNMGKLPPQALEIEEVVLGAIMLEKTSFDRANTLINENDFYTESHKEIYKAFKALSLVNSNIDMLTVANYLKTSLKSEICGGLSYVIGLTNNISSTANLETHCLILKQKRDI